MHSRNWAECHTGAGQGRAGSWPWRKGERAGYIRWGTDDGQGAHQGLSGRGRLTRPIPHVWVDSLGRGLGVQAVGSLRVSVWECSGCIGALLRAGDPVPVPEVARAAVRWGRSIGIP